MQLFIFIRDAEEVLKGNYFGGLSICGEDFREYLARSCTMLDTIDVDETMIDIEMLTQQAVSNIDKEESEIRANAEAEITDLKRRKSELLAITHQPEVA